MIITLNMDTEKDRDTCKKVLSLVLGFGGSDEPTNEQPKKRRGRPPKVKDIYTLAREKAREKIAGRNA